MIYKTLQRKLMVEQQKPYKKSGAIQNKRVYVTLRKNIYLGAKSSQCNPNK